MTVKKLENSSDVNVVTEEVKILTNLLNRFCVTVYRISELF